MTARQWISGETEAKERHFRGIMQMHANICRGIIGRSGGSYLYADLYAGPGHLEHEGHAFDGSPLIAQQILAQAGFDVDAVHYEIDPEVCARLEEALLTPGSMLWWPNAERTHVFTGDCRDEFPKWLRQQRRDPGRLGLVYADPIDDEIPHELFNQAAELFPRVDLLSYVAATQYKRRRGADVLRNGDGATRPLLADHVSAVRKKHVVIRRAHAANHYTFVLWSNWASFPAWESEGFYRLDSPAGRQVFDQLNLTKAQHHRKANTPLPYEEAS